MSFLIVVFALIKALADIGFSLTFFFFVHSINPFYAKVMVVLYLIKSVSAYSTRLTIDNFLDRLSKKD